MRIPFHEHRENAMNTISTSRTVSGLFTGLSLILLGACDHGNNPASPALVVAAVSSVMTDPASGASCAGNDLHITQSDFSLVINGDCRDVVITASNGSVNVSNARSLRVEGNNVTVLNSQVGEVVVAGNDTTLNLTVVGPLSVAGDRNVVLAKSIESVAFDGNENSVNPDNTPPLTDRGRGNKLL